jgi:hypothetical protein
MNVAALAAIVVFFVPANRLWIPTGTPEVAGQAVPPTGARHRNRKK